MYTYFKCVFICIYTYIHTHMCPQPWFFIYVMCMYIYNHHVYVHMQWFMYMYICTHVNTYICIYIFICICISIVCVCVYIYIYTHIYMNTHTHTYVYKYIFTHISQSFAFFTMLVAIPALVLAAMAFANMPNACPTFSVNTSIAVGEFWRDYFDLVISLLFHFILFLQACPTTCAPPPGAYWFDLFDLLNSILFDSIFFHCILFVRVRPTMRAPPSLSTPQWLWVCTDMINSIQLFLFDSILYFLCEHAQQFVPHPLCQHLHGSGYVPTQSFWFTEFYCIRIYLLFLVFYLCEYAQRFVPHPLGQHLQALGAFWRDAFDSFFSILFHCILFVRVCPAIRDPRSLSAPPWLWVRIDSILLIYWILFESISCFCIVSYLYELAQQFVNTLSVNTSMGAFWRDYFDWVNCTLFHFIFFDRILHERACGCTGLFCGCARPFCRYVGLFCGYTWLFPLIYAHAFSQLFHGCGCIMRFVRFVGLFVDIHVSFEIFEKRDMYIYKEPNKSHKSQKRHVYLQRAQQIWQISDFFLKSILCFHSTCASMTNDLCLTPLFNTLMTVVAYWLDFFCLGASISDYLCPTRYKKRHVYLQKSPTNPHEGPTHLQKSPTHL